MLMLCFCADRMPSVSRRAPTLDQLHHSQQPGPESGERTGGEEQVKPHTMCHERSPSYNLHCTHIYTVYIHAHTQLIIVEIFYLAYTITVISVLGPSFLLFIFLWCDQNIWTYENLNCKIFHVLKCTICIGMILKVLSEKTSFIYCSL